MKDSLVIHLHFIKFIGEGETDFYFGSVSAVYDFFNTTEVGCNKETLYKHFNNSDNAVYIAKNCVIKKSRIMRKKRS